MYCNRRVGVPILYCNNVFLIYKRDKIFNIIGVEGFSKKVLAERLERLTGVKFPKNIG